MNDPVREVICLLGLPFDVVTMDETVRRVRDAVRARQRLFLSTPNLNFLIGCQRDAAFRQSVIDSDLSIADGMPLVWISRWLGTPLPERVTGSGLFERLRDEPAPPGHEPIKVYFFGGPPGAAEAAGRSLNTRPGGMVCVGYETPGFGSIDEMSSQDVLDRINASGADFLIVALGAVKGQAWIQRNRTHLLASVISHLGAVVNFAAGTVSRAPRWVQRAGLEWLWRIKEEPALWRRYWRDALALSGLFFGKLLPHGLWLRRWRRAGLSAVAPEVMLRQEADVARLLIRGVIPDPLPASMRATLQQAGELDMPLALDMTQARSFGLELAGSLLLLERALAARPRSLRVVGLSTPIKQLLNWNDLHFYLARSDASPQDQCW
ncbi:MAG: WecB/TagA/CpsF family glycosyltransferase [Candidatus Competibacter sp.]|nr:WecB/TagA/CpsF family glycosyltransferase [Candidatus Competibacter sp.]